MAEFPGSRDRAPFSPPSSFNNRNAPSFSSSFSVSGSNTCDQIGDSSTHMSIKDLEERSHYPKGQPSSPLSSAVPSRISTTPANQQQIEQPRVNRVALVAPRRLSLDSSSFSITSQLQQGTMFIASVSPSLSAAVPPPPPSTSGSMTPFQLNNSNNNINNHRDSSSSSNSSSSSSSSSSSNISLADSLQHKIRADHSKSLQQREAETRTRNALEQTKMDLIRKYEEDLQHSNEQLVANKERYEQLLTTKENELTALKASSSRDLAAVESKCRSSLELMNKMWQEKESKLVSDIQTQEKRHRIELEQVQQECALRIQTLEGKHAMEKGSVDIVERTRSEAQIIKMRAVFEKKLRKYEQQVKAVTERCANKELVLQGALEESRRETARVETALEAREASLREELVRKDHRLLSVQVKLDSVESITAQCEKWFAYSKDLATAAVYCCSTAKELPDLPDTSKSSGGRNKDGDLFAAAYRSLSENSSSAAAKEKDEEEKERQRVYRKFRAKNMGVDKGRLEKMLLISERIIGRIKAVDKNPTSTFSGDDGSGDI